MENQKMDVLTIYNQQEVSKTKKMDVLTIHNQQEVCKTKKWMY